MFPSSLSPLARRLDRLIVALGLEPAKIWQVARYALVGGSLIAAEYGAYLVMIWARLAPPVTAHLIARFIGGAIGYGLHARFTFRQSNDHARRIPRYAAVIVFNAFLSAALLYALLHLAGPVGAKVAADVICAGLSYLITRRFVFAAAREAA